MNIAHSKGTKRSDSIGIYGRKRGGSCGKGDIISGTFGDGWVSNLEDRLSKRLYECSDITCGKLKPSGKCEHCGFEPSGNKGW